MNLSRRLFEHCAPFFDAGLTRLPRPCVFEDSDAAVCGASQRFGAFLSIGTTRQMSRWGAELRRRVFSRFFEYRDAARWRRAEPARACLWRSFFSGDSPDPALIYATRAWPLLANQVRAAGLQRKDKTQPLVRFSLTCPPISIDCGNGFPIEVDPTLLQFYHEERPDRRMLVPRVKQMIMPASGIHVGEPFVECGIGVGTIDDERVLYGGVYKPNNTFFRRNGDFAYLDVFTLTLAKVRLAPQIPFVAKLQAFHSAFSGRTRDRRRTMTEHRRTDGASQSELDAEWLLWSRMARLLPADCAAEVEEGSRVHLLRATFHPETLDVVVLLFADRSFKQFLGEHVGVKEAIAAFFCET